MQAADPSNTSKVPPTDIARTRPGSWGFLAGNQCREAVCKKRFRSAKRRRAHELRQHGGAWPHAIIVESGDEASTTEDW